MWVARSTGRRVWNRRNARRLGPFSHGVFKKKIWFPWDLDRVFGGVLRKLFFSMGPNWILRDIARLTELIRRFKLYLEMFFFSFYGFGWMLLGFTGFCVGTFMVIGGCFIGFCKDRRCALNWVGRREPTCDVVCKCRCHWVISLANGVAQSSRWVGEDAIRTTRKRRRVGSGVAERSLALWREWRRRQPMSASKGGARPDCDAAFGKEREKKTPRNFLRECVIGISPVVLYLATLVRCEAAR